MIYGIGTDIIDICRIEKAIKREHFFTRVFSKEERAELAQKKVESVAACFCAKEAFAKAMGTGVRGFLLTEVSLLHEENGKPYLHLSGAAEALAKKANITSFHVSVSHTNTLATCTVVAEQ